MPSLRTHIARRPGRRATVAYALAIALLSLSCGGDNGSRAVEPRSTAAAPRADDGAPRDGSRPARSRGGPEVRTYATGLEVPWDMAFLPDGGALVTERPGRVRLIGADGELRAEPVARIEVGGQGEGGLLGLALDPEFDRNRFVYLCYTTGDALELARYRFDRGRLREEVDLLDGVRAGVIHDGGRIAFGPDGRLYVTTGDTGDPESAQDPGSLNGKFLRLGPRQYRGAGGRPEVVSTGHRNPQGFDWEPGGRRLVATEHGPDGDDEVNEIVEGRNYGWPRVQGRDHGGFAAPLAIYEETIAPSGATFVSLPDSKWTGDFLIAALAGEQLRRVRLDESRVVLDEALFAGRFGRLRTVVEGPDGALYALTSNRDGRGIPGDGDDRVLRIVPPAD